MSEEKFHGHPLFHKLTQMEVDLHNAKNHDYAAGGHPLGNFFRVSNILRMYPGLNPADPAIVAVIYAIKQIDAYLWIKSQGIQTKVEGIFERCQDVSVYFKLIQCIEHDLAMMAEHKDTREPVKPSDKKPELTIVK